MGLIRAAQIPEQFTEGKRDSIDPNRTVYESGPRLKQLKTCARNLLSPLPSGFHPATCLHNRLEELSLHFIHTVRLKIHRRILSGKEWHLFCFFESRLRRFARVVFWAIHGHASK